MHRLSTADPPEPMPRLVEMDLSVNTEKVPVAADAVTVRDVISPNGLTIPPVTPANGLTLRGACP